MIRRIKRILASLLVFMMAVSNTIAFAQEMSVLTLPSELRIIEEEAFYGDTSIEKVVVPEGATEIGSKAFADSSLKEIDLPDTLETIADNSFDGCTDLTITAPENSYAYDWAVDKGYIDNVQSSPVEDFEYTIGINKVTITGYTGSDAAVVIPNTINNYPVTSIGEEAFFGCTSLTSIVIPDSVTSIGSSAFYGCSSLAEVYAESLESWLSINFRNQASTPMYCADKLYIGGQLLTNVVIPDGTISIGYAAFFGCSSLTSIVIPNSVISIGNYAFSGCSSLTGITIPDSVTSIGIYAFSGCSSLTSIVIPDGVASIGIYAFSRCSNLTSIIIPDGVTSIDSYAFYKCTSLTSIVIPDSVTSIMPYVFGDCSSLTSIAIPDSVTSIKNYAFENCRSLSSIYIPESVVSISEIAFMNCTNLKNIYGKAGSFAETFADNNGYEFVEGTIPDTTTVPELDMSSATLDKDTYAPGETITISGIKVKNADYVHFDGNNLHLDEVNSGESAFDVAVEYSSEYQTLSDITMILSATDAVEGEFYISVQAFDSEGNFCTIDKSSLKYTVEYKLEETPASEFEYEIVDDEYVVINGYIGSNTEIVIPSMIDNCPVTYIGESAFNDCSSLTNIVIPDSVTSIGNYAFNGCSSLTSIDLPDTITSIGYNAFGDCSSLTGVAIPDNVTQISGGIFFYCSSLTSIVIPDGVTSIGETAFGHCSSLTSIVIPDSVTSIGDYAFTGCISLTSIVIPDKVTHIGEGAFVNCSSLESVTILTSDATFGNTVFANCSSDLIIYGKENSAALTYANENGITFVIIEQEIHTLSVPTNVTAVTQSSSSIVISWDEVEGATGYYIYRSTGDSGTNTRLRIFTRIKTITSGSTLNYTDTDLAANTTYYYIVSAYNADVESASSSYASAKTGAIADNLMEGYPTITGVETVDSYSLRVNWTKVTGADGYRIWRENVATGEGEYLNDIIGGDVLTCLDTGLDPDTIYAYTVAAYAHALVSDSVYISLDSNTVEGTTSAESVAVLSAPIITEIELNDATSLTVRWSEVENAEGFLIYRADSETGEFVEIDRYNLVYQHHVDYDLITGQTYYYKVQAFAYSESGRFYTGPMSATASGMPIADNPIEGHPTITGVETVDSYSLRVSWTKVTGADGYHIRRENVTTGEGEYLDDIVGGDVLTCLDTNLDPDTTYAYTVAAYAHALVSDSVYISLYSNTVEGTTSTETVAELSAPIITEIELRDTTSLTIRWSEVENAEGFLIYRADSETGEFVEIDRYNLVYQHHVDRGLVTGQTYYYMVQAFAYSESGRFYTGPMSSAVAGTPVLDNPLSGFPSITYIEALDCTRVKILWVEVIGADGYNLRREDTATGEISNIRIAGSSTLSYTDTGLSPATNYAYTLEAYAKALVTDTTYLTVDSNTVSVTTNTEEIIELETPDIADISVLDGNTSVSIEWTEVPNAVGYYLYRSIATSGNYEIIQTINATTSTTDTQLTQGEKYYYRVQAYAVGSAGTVFTSERSGQYRVTMPETIDAPTIYVIACGPSSISITWNEISNAEDYLVYRSYTKDSGFTQIAETKDPFYIDSNVEVDIQVYYKVKARTASGITSSYSNRDSDYIDPNDYVEEIDAPDVLSITVISDTSLKVRWQVIDNAVNYHVYRSTQGSSKGYEKVGETPAQTFTDTRLTPDTKYWYRIRAISSSGTESVLGVQDSATTSSGSGGSDYEDVLVTSITVDPSSLNLFVGESYNLYADTSPSNATDSSVTWKSNNTSVATVTASGKVTAVNAGTATITAMAADGSGISDTCLVTVTTATEPVVSMPSVSGYSLEPSVVTTGETFTLKGILSGNGATIEKVTIAAFPAGQHALNGVHVYFCTPKTETYDLSNVTAIKTGYTYSDAEGRSMSLDAGNSYDILIYAALSNGEYFRNDTNPSQTVTVTAAPTTEPFVRVYGVDNADLNGRTLSFAYNKFSGKTIYVLTNIDIMPWSSDEDAFNITYRSVTYTDEGTLYELAVNGNENPYADVRTGELRIYENGEVGTTSPWATIKVKQAGNPNVPVVVSAALDDDGVMFDQDNTLHLIAGDHNGYTLMVELENDVSANWYVYTDDENVADAYKSSVDNLYYIKGLSSGTTSLYISDVYASSLEEIDEETVYKVCDITVSKNRYRAILFGTNVGLLSDENEDAGIQFVTDLKEKFIQNTYIGESIELSTSTSGNSYKLLNMIDNMAATGESTDITYICIIAHGYNPLFHTPGIALWDGGFDENGAPTTEFLSYSTLFEHIAQIPGKIVFITASCYSGSAIEYAEEYGDKITVLAASSSGKTSDYYEIGALFIVWLLEAGDTSGDGIVTVRESFDYAKTGTDLINLRQNWDKIQSWIVWSTFLTNGLPIELTPEDLYLQDPQFFGDESLPLWGMMP